MNKKITLVFVAIVMLSCNFLFPAEKVPVQSPVINPTQPISQSDNNSSSSDGFTQVRLHPADGDLQTMLAEQTQKAKALDEIPVVEFDATWCPPCKAIESAINSKNELMLKAYAGTYLIKLDVDEWGWNGKGIKNFRFDAIPVYFKLDAQGKQTGERIDGGAWGEDIPENIAPVMDKFFHGG